ncbi:MAG: ATP-binding cassette domain-containing protein [Acidimicrobiales bacterium]
MARTEAPVLLGCRGVTVRFGGLAALDAVDLEVRQGEIVGLIGPNGAGKTTLMDCISGFLSPVAGAVSYDGTDLSLRSAGERAGRGIGRTLQNVRLSPSSRCSTAFGWRCTATSAAARCHTPCASRRRAPRNATSSNGPGA